MKRVGILSLGCARNLVDSEVIAGNLEKKGYQVVDLELKPDAIAGGRDKIDIALVNTCTFIKEAKQESISTILELIELKKQGRLKRIVVAGCLSQRYSKELIKELPQVDAFSGVISLNHRQQRFPLTAPHYAYVKICEGCINKCSFCVIPKIKQNFSSRRVESVVEEVNSLEVRGCTEVNLIGQDITAYGYDLYGESRLVDLVRQILKNCQRISWIRLLYLSPERISQELIELIASQPRIVKYIDLPLQHINNRILKLMRRNFDSARIYKLIENIRKKIPDVALRTSLIVGFPGETEKDFQELLEFVREVEFQRLGLFMYSREEQTAAYGFSGQVPEGIKRKRYNAIMSVQQEIARRINQSWQGKVMQVLIEEKQEEGVYIGRSQYDAPEVDGLVYVNSKADLPIGGLTNIKITDSLEYDLIGEPSRDYNEKGRRG